MDIKIKFSLSESYKSIGIPVSQIINQHANSSFSGFINKLRVKEAICLVHSDEYKGEKIISIAYGSGFSNKVTFNSAFKKITSYTPTEYRKINCSSAKMSIAS